MFIESFLGRKPSHFQFNPTIKAFIAAETLLWSGWNFFVPLIGVFVVEKIEGGNVEVVATATSFYLISRLATELLSAKYFVKRGDRVKLTVSILGSLILGIGYLGFLAVNSVPLLFCIYILLGIGLGIASPAKLSLFSIHLDKNKEASEWSVYDAITFSAMAISGIIGGLIAGKFGFDSLFVIASFINLLGIFPYFFLLGKYSKD